MGTGCRMGARQGTGRGMMLENPILNPDWDK